MNGFEKYFPTYYRGINFAVRLEITCFQQMKKAFAGDIYLCWGWLGLFLFLCLFFVCHYAFHYTLIIHLIPLLFIIGLFSEGGLWIVTEWISWKRLRDGIRMIIGSIIFLLFILILLLSPLSPSPRRHYFTSPKKVHTLLLEETSLLSSCRIAGYPVALKIFKKGNADKQYTTISFGEPDFPITEGRYQLEWETEDMVKIMVNSNSTEQWFFVDFTK